MRPRLTAYVRGSNVPLRSTPEYKTEKTLAVCWTTVFNNTRSTTIRIPGGRPICMTEHRNRRHAFRPHRPTAIHMYIRRFDLGQGLEDRRSGVTCTSDTARIVSLPGDCSYRPSEM